MISQIISNSDTTFEWKNYTPDTFFRFTVYFIPEDEGGYSVVAAHLPGVGSQGDTLAEAIVNAKEAFQGVLGCYRDCNMPIQWKENEEDMVPGALRGTIYVTLEGLDDDGRRRSRERTAE